jgi:hypothetical protein
MTLSPATQREEACSASVTAIVEAEASSWRQILDPKQDRGENRSKGGSTTEEAMLETDADGIPKLSTPEKYEQYALNVEAQSPELARKARKHAVRLKAANLAVELRASSQVERECLEAMAAYEWTLFKKHGRRLKASYLRRAIKKVGIITAVDNAVSKDAETVGYQALVAEGMQEMLFEVVVLKHQTLFSPDAVTKSKKRMAAWQAQDQAAI